MKIKYLAHSCFMITSEAGIKLITDPYTASDNLNYDEIKESADIVTTSHGHFDHSNIAAVRGNPKLVKEAGTAEAEGIIIKGIPVYHDATGGKSRGKNIIFCFDVDGIRICHLGDLGQQLDDKQVAELGTVDILLIPVGGFYTIDARVASDVSRRIKPRVIIPMHYKTAKCSFPIADVDEFLRDKDGVSRLDTSETEFKREELPDTAQIIVLTPAL